MYSTIGTAAYLFHDSVLVNNMMGGAICVVVGVSRSCIQRFL